MLIHILARGILVGRLQEICVKENVCCDGEALEALIEGMHNKKFSLSNVNFKFIIFLLIIMEKASDGDLRRAITFLQSTANLKTETSVTVEDINEITGVCS